MWLPVAILFYLVYLVVAVPVVAFAAAVVYAVAVPCIFVGALFRVLVTKPGWLPEPVRKPRIPAGSDPAVPQYFYGPAVVDADRAVRLAVEASQRFLNRGVRRVASAFESSAALFTWPLGAGGAVGIAVGTAAGAVGAACLGAVQLVVLGVGAALARAASLTLRLADSGMLAVKNVKMFCPECGRRVLYPGYLCPRGHRHRDIRPGRFGILKRRCECGQPMRTLLLLGSSRMEAFCPYCDQLLEHGPGDAPEVVLPFFGATGAGKTRLMFSIVTMLREQTGASLADSVTVRRLGDAAVFLSPDRSTEITPVELPRGHVVEVTVGRRTRILQLFDAAGERFYDADRTRELGYLGQARTFILVIDPLSVDAYWDALPSDRQEVLAPLRSVAPSPDLAYQQTHQAIEALGVPLRQCRLAVVFSRADLLDLPALLGGAVADWACSDLGLGNMVRSIRLNFKESEFFQVAAVMRAETVDKSVQAPLRWMLDGTGIHLPDRSAGDDGAGRGHGAGR